MALSKKTRIVLLTVMGLLQKIAPVGTHLIDLNTTVNGTLNVNNATSLGGSLAVTGITTLTGAATANGGLTVPSGQLLSVDGNLAVEHLFAVSDTTDLRVTCSTHLLGQLDMNVNKFVVGANGNTSVGGTLNVTGKTTLGTSRIFGEKTSIASIGTTPTNILTITFANLAGTSTPLLKGANVKVHCFVSGAISSVDSINCFEGNFYLSPGATGGANSTKTLVSESTATTVGTEATITSGISGTGTTATITLTSSQTITSQSVIIYYEVISDNIVSVS